MPKNIIFILVLFLILGLVVVYIIIKPNINFNQNTNEEINYDFGVITTSALKNQSYITYYNENGEKIKKQSLKLGWLGSTFGSNGEDENFVYTTVHAGEKGDAVILNKKNGKIELVPMTFNMLTMNADEENIYGAASTTLVSGIVSYNMNTKILKHDLIQNAVTGCVYPYKDILYVSAYGDEKNQETQYLYLYDKNTMELKEKILNNVSCNIFYMQGVGDYIYMANTEAPGFNSQQGSNILSEFNINTKTFTYYELDDVWLNKILLYGDKLIITHWKAAGGIGKNITIFDLKTKEKKLIPLQNNLYKNMIKKNKLYSYDQEYLYIYNIDNNFSLEKKIYIKNKDQYVTTIFSS